MWVYFITSLSLNAKLEICQVVLYSLSHSYAKYVYAYSVTVWLTSGILLKETRLNHKHKVSEN